MLLLWIWQVRSISLGTGLILTMAALPTTILHKPVSRLARRGLPRWLTILLLLRSGCAGDRRDPGIGRSNSHHRIAPDLYEPAQFSPDIAGRDPSLGSYRDYRFWGVVGVRLAISLVIVLRTLLNLYWPANSLEHD